MDPVAAHGGVGVTECHIASGSICTPASNSSYQPASRAHRSNIALVPQRQLAIDGPRKGPSVEARERCGHRERPGKTQAERGLSQMRWPPAPSASVGKVVANAAEVPLPDLPARRRATCDPGGRCPCVAHPAVRGRQPREAVISSVVCTGVRGSVTAAGALETASTGRVHSRRSCPAARLLRDLRDRQTARPRWSISVSFSELRARAPQQVGRIGDDGAFSSAARCTRSDALGPSSRGSADFHENRGRTPAACPGANSHIGASVSGKANSGIVPKQRFSTSRLRRACRPTPNLPDFATASLSS